MKLKHLLVVFFLALCAISILFWPARSTRVKYWQDKLFSPGSISLAHQWDAEGNKIICQGCHKPGQAITNSSCRECHDRKYFADKNPLLTDSHQILDREDQCLRCHGEHDGNYMSLKVAGFNAEVHKALPVKTDKCIDCHRAKGSQAHPAVTNKDCGSCHKNYAWSSDFEHKKQLSKAKNPQELLKQCLECHDKDHHYREDATSPEGCIICHEFWGRRRKSRPIPFPEKIFRGMELSKKFNVTLK